MRSVCNRHPRQFGLGKLSQRPRVKLGESRYLKVPEIVFVAGTHHDVVWSFAHYRQLRRENHGRKGRYGERNARGNHRVNLSWGTITG
jgi:hypothetical protein